MTHNILVYPFEKKFGLVSFDSRKAFLNRLAATDNSPICADRVAVVVAHPDDEAVGIGGQLHRLQNVNMVHVTDGAPHDLAFARYVGFETREAYAQARRDELAQALSIARLPADAHISLGVPDQQVATSLCATTLRLCELFAERRIEIVLTHPYEGGHPDHDSTAFSVHFACRLMKLRGQQAPEIIEMASYHAGEEGGVFQRFIEDPSTQEIVAQLTPDQMQLKTTMFAAHKTQSYCLKAFHASEERFRPAPAYDFSALPNNGKLYYNSFRSGMTATRWQRLVQEAIGELDTVAIAA